MRRRALRRFKRRGGQIEARARAAVERGEIRPLREVMRVVRKRSDAEVLDVDLHKRPRGWIYALRVMTARGRVRDVFLDARTLKVLHLGDSAGEDGVPLPPELAQPQSPPLNKSQRPAPNVLPPPPSKRPEEPE